MESQLIGRNGTARAEPIKPVVAAARQAVVSKELVKVYPNGTRALRGVSLAVREGEILGILGPNGAGKSTAIGIFGTLVRATSGTASVAGFDVVRERAAVRRKIGFAMQEVGVDDLATGREFLRVQAELYGLDREAARRRSGELLRLFDMEAAADKRISSYSGGMKRRIDLAAALMHRPAIIFLDEPSEGLDPRARKALWDSLRRLRRDSKATIVLSTHFMEEADQLCDRIAIIDRGQVVAVDTPARLKAGAGPDRLRVHLEVAPSERQRQSLAAAFPPGSVRVEGTWLELRLRDASKNLLATLTRIERTGVAVVDTQLARPNLEDAYLKLTGRPMDAPTPAREVSA